MEERYKKLWELAESASFRVKKITRGYDTDEVTIFLRQIQRNPETVTAQTFDDALFHLSKKGYDVNDVDALLTELKAEAIKLDQTRYIPEPPALPPTPTPEPAFSPTPTPYAPTETTYTKHDLTEKLRQAEREQKTRIVQEMDALLQPAELTKNSVIELRNKIAQEINNIPNPQPRN